MNLERRNYEQYIVISECEKKEAKQKAKEAMESEIESGLNLKKRLERNFVGRDKNWSSS